MENFLGPRNKNLNIPEVPSLFCEFHGISKTSLQETADLTKELCETCGASGFQFGIEEKDRNELWRARHEAWETIHQAHPKKETLIVDAAVPISRYPQMIVFSQNLVDESHVDGYVFGHAGDGNLHVVIAGDPNDKNEWSTLEKINHLIVEKAVELGGTCTGEHGIGKGLQTRIVLPPTVPVAGQVDDRYPEMQHQFRQQGLPDATVQTPAVDQHQVGAVACCVSVQFHQYVISD